MNPRPFARLSLQWKLPLLVSGLLLAFSAAVGGVAYSHLRKSAIEAEQERLPRIAAQLVNNLQASFEQLGHRLHARVATPTLLSFLRSRSDPDKARMLAALLPGGGTDSTTVAIEIWDPVQRSLATSGLPTSVLARLNARDAVAVNAGDDFSAVGRLQALGDTLLYPVVTAVAERGERLGYLVLWRRLLSNPGSLKSMEGLFGSDVKVFIGSAGGIWTDQVRAVNAPPINVVSPRGLARYERDSQGQSIAAVAAIPGTVWQIVVELPEATVLASSRRFLEEVGALAAVLLMAALMVIGSYSREITGPLRELTTAIDARSAGIQLAPVRVVHEDERGKLAVAFIRMAERIDYETAARTASEQQWQQLFYNSPQAMFVYDLETLAFLAVNAAAELQYGYTRDEFLSLTIVHIIVPGELALAMENIDRLRRGGEAERAWRHRTKDGAVIDVETHSHALSFGGRSARLVLTPDVSKRKTLEAQLRQSQKMEAIGQLAAGVAHDFNNVLTVISGNAELLRETLTADGDGREEVDEILRASVRASSLTRQLLAFGRQQVLQPTVLDFNETVAATERMLRRLLGANIAAEWVLEPALRAVKVDPGQMEQVILNLAVNARDAMEHGGKLTVETSNVTLDLAGARARNLATAGDYVLLSVSDTGSGMSRDVQQHVFEPFFTTKAQGKGTGLGLSTVYGIVTQSGGNVLVYSEPGIGTTFKLYFPATSEAPSEVVEEDDPGPIAHGTTVLLVEDEAPVRKFAAAALTRAGYEVFTAENAAEALVIADGMNGSLDLLLTDVVMPGINGRELGDMLVQSKPNLRVLYMSGYSGQAVVRHGVLPRGLALLEKPFSIAALLSKVGQSLVGRV